MRLIQRGVQVDRDLTADRPGIAVAPLLPFVVIGPVAALVVATSFGGLYGQDAFAYFDYAVGPLRQALLERAPLPPFYWPPGYPLLVALLSFALGPNPVAGQLISLVAGGLVPVFTMLFAQDVLGPQAGAIRIARFRLSVPLLAGILAGCTPQLWQSSAVVMSDTTALAAATLGAWAVARYGRTARPGWLCLAALGLSWAILARWIYVLVAGPCLVYALPALARRGRKSALAHGLAAVLVAGLVFAPVLLTMLRESRSSESAAAPFTGQTQVVGWDPRNALARTFHTADGTQSYRLPNGLYFALAAGHVYFLTPIPALLIPIGAIAVLRRRTAAPALLLIVWPALIYAFLAGIAWQSLRWILAYLPPLATLVALGAAVAQRWLLERRTPEVGTVPGGVAAELRLGRSAARLVGWSLPLLLAGSLVLMAAAGTRLTLSFIVRHQHEVETMRWVEAQLPADARLLTFGPTLTYLHYSRLETLELFFQTPAGLETLLQDGRPTFLLVDPISMETQWRDKSPGQNYRWLRDGPGLSEVAVRDSNTLSRVGPATR